MHPGVLAPIDAHGGPGDDTLIYQGAGSANLYGDSGDDYLETGPTATGTIILNGGSGDDYVTHGGLGGATLIGGPGNDQLFGGIANDLIYGDDPCTTPPTTSTAACEAAADGGDEIDGRGGSDKIYAGGGNDLIRLKMPTTAVLPTIEGGTGTDFLVVTASTGPDNLRVSKGSDLRIYQVANTGSVDANGIEELDVDLGAGADKITIDTLNNSSVKVVSVNTGQIVTDTGQTVLVPDPDDPNIKVKQPVLIFTPDGAADTITIEGRDDVGDVFTITGADPVNDRITDVRVVHQNDSDVFVTNSVRSEGDTLVINGNGGADRIDASGLGNTNPASSTVYPDLLVLMENGNAGGDTLIGSPFNDVLNGGIGSDRVTGGPGLDTFFDDSLPASLRQSGTMFTWGSTPFANSPYADEQSMINSFRTQDDPSFRNIGSGDHYASGAVVEDLKGLFEAAILKGGDGNNTLVVNDVDNQIFVGGVAQTVVPWVGHATLDNRGNTANGAPEHYVVTINVGNAAKIDIVDTGGGSGVDELDVFGTNQADNLYLNAAGSGSFRVGSVSARDVATTRIQYQQVERVSIYTLGGADQILSDDTTVTTVIETGGGDDHIVVGTVPLIPDTGNRTLEFPDGVPVADVDNMTNGNSAPLFILGQDQNDTFEINHNRAKVYAHGGNGDDRFLLKTFIALKENPDNPDDITNLTTLFGGQGTNRYEYVQNGPVEINGGPGIDTVVVIGTPIGDRFIVTDKYIAGAGRIVTFTNVERVEVDGAGGPDEIWVLSTSASFETVIDGGTGDDTIHIGGTPPLLVFDPPPFQYTPPAFTVTLPPSISFTTMTINLNGFTFTVPFREWVAAGGPIFPGSDATTISVATTFAQGVANHLTSAAAAGDPLLRVDAPTVGNVSARLRFAFLPFLFNTNVEITVGTFALNYEVGTVVQETKLVQPPTVTVDPAPFAFQAQGVTSVAGILGRLTIKGGDAPEGLGDRVIIHNQGGTSGLGQIISRTLPRIVQVGEDQNGNAIYGQDQDISDPTHPVLLSDTFTSVEGMGLGIPSAGKTALDGVNVFHGVELQGIEALDVRLAGGDDTFTVVDTPANLNLSISGSAGNDTFNLKSVSGPTRILGGPGSDLLGRLDARRHPLARQLPRRHADRRDGAVVPRQRPAVAELPHPAGCRARDGLDSAHDRGHAA